MWFALRLWWCSGTESDYQCNGCGSSLGINDFHIAIMCLEPEFSLLNLRCMIGKKLFANYLFAV